MAHYRIATAMTYWNGEEFTPDADAALLYDTGSDDEPVPAPRFEILDGAGEMRKAKLALGIAEAAGDTPPDGPPYWSRV